MAKVRGKVTFKEHLCKGCELCTTVCPVNIVKMAKDRINAKRVSPRNRLRDGKVHSLRELRYHLS
jgi:formate hydrogenlyase subunit 6/NADH:ubiquinone oxidoreductase subunit I